MHSLNEKVERILHLSRADACVVIGSESSSANLRWANNTSTTNGTSRSESIAVVSIMGARVGKVASSHVPTERLEDLVRQSEAACAGKPDAPDHMPLPAGDGTAPDNWGIPSSEVDVSDFGPPVAALGAAFRRAESEQVLLFGYAEQTASSTYLATSAGVRARHDRTQASFQMSAKSPDYRVSVSTETLEPTVTEADVAGMHDHLARRLAWSKNTIALPAGRYPVILEPAALGEILMYAYMSMSARDAQEGRSAFSRPGGQTCIGEEILPASVNLYSDPAEPGLESPGFHAGTGSSNTSSVFDCGIPLMRTDWVRAGRLEHLIATRSWASRAGGEAQPYIGNLVMPGDESRSLEDMIASTERALLVTRFWYTRMLDQQNLLLTGLTRDGVFLVEGGEVKGAVNNFRYIMSPLAALRQATEAGSTKRAFHMMRTPHLRVDDFHMSSVSQAT